MLTRKPAETEGWLTATKPHAPLIDVFPSGVEATPSPPNALIPRAQFARMPVPEGFDSANLSAINKGGFIRNCARSAAP